MLKVEIKISALVLIFMFGVFSGSSFAQSGRRVAPAPASTPRAQQTQDDSVQSQQADSSAAGGYSESQANAPRSISVSPALRNRDKKSKKEQKKDAQNQQQQTQTTTTTASATTDGDEDIVKVETNLVTIPVSVYDRNGLYISNLDKQNFKIFEDGVEQEVAYFGTSERPFTVVLLIDVSPSTAYKIDEIRQAAVAFVDQLKPLDNVMVIEFDESVHVLTEQTTDRQKIYKAINRANFGSGTALYDAVDFSLRKRLDKIDGRKAIVLFTDGVDTYSSRADYESTVQDAEESEAMIFPIYYNTFLSSRGIGTGGVMSTPPTLGLPGGIGGQPIGMSSAEYSRGRAYLTELAAATGGRVFRPESTPGGLTTAFEGIAEELRRQYSIGYYPTNEGVAGQRKQIRVRVNRPKLVIRTRDSYIVGANASATPAPASTPKKSDKN
ncbi:MAG: VWA domain-containing protein [Acidobacteria bacterium]|nr:VWA domain-containing protein [Acidobacteriota bacterium]